MGASYLFDLADTLLDTAVASLSEARTGLAPPTKTYVSHTDPVADYDGCCAEAHGYGGGILTVHAGSDIGDPLDFAPLDGTQGCGMRMRARFTITVLRCVPTIDSHAVPDAATLDASAQRLLTDLWCLVAGLMTARSDETWPGTLGASCRDVLLEDVMPLEPEGGCAGWKVTVSTLVRDAGVT